MAPPRSTSTRGIPRLAILITVAVAVVVVGVLVALSATGGSDGAPSGTLTGADEAAAIFAGVPQQGDRLGASGAPVEISEYADLQCPFCAQAADTTVPTLVSEFVAPGTATLVFRPMAFIGPDSERGALAALAAGSQNALWTYAELLYRNQGTENSGWLSERTARDAAEALGLDVATFDSDRRGSAARAVLAASEASARTAGVTSTPTFIVTGPNGRVVIRDFTDLGEFRAAVQSVR